MTRGKFYEVLNCQLANIDNYNDLPCATDLCVNYMTVVDDKFTSDDIEKIEKMVNLRFDDIVAVESAKELILKDAKSPEDILSIEDYIECYEKYFGHKISKWVVYKICLFRREFIDKYLESNENTHEAYIKYKNQCDTEKTQIDPEGFYYGYY